MARRRRHVRLRRVPAVAQHHPHRVTPRAQVAGHVVARVQHPRAQLQRQIVVVVGRRRIQHLPPHLGAVDAQLVVAQPAQVQPRPRRRRPQRELRAQQRRRDTPLRRDPGTLPVVRLQQPHLEPRRLAPGAGAILRVPGAHPPPAALPAAKRSPRVGHVHRPLRGYLAAVPDQFGPRAQRRAAAGHHDPVGGLQVPARLRRRQPAQPRPARVDSQRIDRILAAQLVRPRGRVVVPAVTCVRVTHRAPAPFSGRR